MLWTIVKIDAIWVRHRHHDIVQRIAILSQNSIWSCCIYIHLYSLLVNSGSSFRLIVFSDSQWNRTSSICLEFASQYISYWCTIYLTFCCLFLRLQCFYLYINASENLTINQTKSSHKWCTLAYKTISAVECCCHLPKLCHLSLQTWVLVFVMRCGHNSMCELSGQRNQAIASFPRHTIPGITWNNVNTSCSSRWRR